MLSNSTNQQLFAHYLNSNYSYDELLDAAGNLREHWKVFFQSFTQMGADEMDNRCKDIARLLKENGVTYNIYGDPQGLKRPWKLDPIPYVISKQEWHTIESGLQQRAELLNLVLQDVYGPQNLIKQGILPMELVYNHSGFLRQCVGIPQLHKHSLTLYAGDIARSCDGKIWLVNDRTQAPSGSGYAFENRTAMARTLPELFTGLKVRRLTTYFSSLKEALLQQAPFGNTEPRIVILTPGPSNETYFEHSYLSSVLGFSLVQGNDLMVKDCQVWLKTLGGLEKVDIILRRVDDVYCDPLELKEDSQLGIPGLLQAVRSGNVTVANPLGSSVLENPGLIPFLNAASQYYFNQQLIMPTVASWWCGQAKECQYVLNNLASLVVRKIQRNASGTSSINTSALSKVQIANLKKEILAQPHLFVGQEKIDFASTPSFIDGKIEPRNALFRSFLVSNGDSYTVMTGGLTRTSAFSGQSVISNQLGGLSKDTWIISAEPGRTLNVRKELAVPYMATNGTNMLPSHTAENFFWVGRYVERILGNARLQRTVMQMVADGNKPNADGDLRAENYLLQALTQCTFTYPGFTDAEKQAELLQQPWPELHDILFNDNRSGSLSSNLAWFYKAVYAVRDHWSTDTWRVLRNIEDAWNEAANATSTRHLTMLHCVDEIITYLVAFVGLNRENISREQGWAMIDMGRKIEQSLLLINLLKSTLIAVHDEQVEYELQEAVLASNDCLVNYRYKYRAHLQLPLIVELMLFDANNPRSLIYQIQRLKNYLLQLPLLGSTTEYTAHQSLINQIDALLKQANISELCILDAQLGCYQALDTFLQEIINLLCAIPNAISTLYFVHSQTQKQLFTAQIDQEIDN